MSAANLWLEPRYGNWDAQKKDALEFVLWKLVCDGKEKLAAAQEAIATNWVEAYHHYATPANLARYHFRGEPQD